MKKHYLVFVFVLLLLAIYPTLAMDNPTAVLRDPLWTFQTEGAVWSSPTVTDGIVYFGSDDGNFYAVEIASQELKWQFATGGFVRVRPAVVNGVVYFASDDGYLYAVSADSGAEVWRLDIGNAAAPRLSPANDFNWDYLQSSPVVADGLLYIGSADGSLYAVNAETGETAWQFQTEERVRTTPAVANGLVYFGGWDGFVYALDAQSGEERWRYNSQLQYIHIQSSPTIVDGVVYIGSRSSKLYAFDAETGDRLWSFTYKKEWVESTPAVADGMIYCGSSLDSRLYAVDTNGRRQWEFIVNGVAFSSPTVVDGVVYVGEAYWGEGVENYFYAIGTEQEDSVVANDKALWRVAIGDSIDTAPAHMTGVISSPIISDGVVYFGGMDGKLYAVSVQ